MSSSCVRCQFVSELRGIIPDLRPDLQRILLFQFKSRNEGLVMTTDCVNRPTMLNCDFLNFRCQKGVRILAMPSLMACTSFMTRWGLEDSPKSKLPPIFRLASRYIYISVFQTLIFWPEENISLKSEVLLFVLVILLTWSWRLSERLIFDRY